MFLQGRIEMVKNIPRLNGVMFIKTSQRISHSLKNFLNIIAIQMLDINTRK